MGTHQKKIGFGSIRKLSKPALVSGAVAGVAILAGAGIGSYALAGATIARPSNLYGCVRFTDRALVGAYTVASNFKGCPSGSFAVTVASGAAGPQGVPGKDAVVTVTDTSASNVTLTYIGGSWSGRHTFVKSVTLDAGTYQVQLTGDFYKTATTTATPVLQIQLNGADRQLTGYTGAFPYDVAEKTGLAGDGTPAGLEQTATAVGTIVIPKGGATVSIDAFGYNPNTSGDGGGDFAVNVTAQFDLVGSSS